jgi:uncharacterized protein (DUF608 family)
MCSHLGAIRLAALRIVERMAHAMGDTAFEAQCRQWFADGSKAMEDKMWVGHPVGDPAGDRASGYYLNFYDEKTGRRSDAIMGYQLDGQLVADMHGVTSVFRADRVPMVLDTIQRCNMPAAKCGALSFADRNGRPLSPEEKIVEYGSTFIFLPEIMMLAMNYLYGQQRDLGLNFLRRAMEEMVCVQGHPWDLPNMIAGDTGRRIFGTDYYQNMMLWALPAALCGQDLRSSVGAGGLIDRILAAGRDSP